MLHRGLLIGLIVVCASLSPSVNTSRGQSSYGNIIPSNWARRIGLQRVWSANVALDRSRGRVGSVAMHVSDSRTFTVVEVESDGRKTHFSERDLGSDGQPLGLAGAERLARNLIETLKALGREFKLTQVKVPAVTLYLQTDRGGLHAIDGETGRTIWAVKVGRSDQPTSSAAANDNYVAMVNGSQLYLIDVLDGREAWRRPLDGIPTLGPAIGAEWVFVPTLGGGIEAYPIEDGGGTPGIYRGSGAVLAPPTATPFTVSWPTEGSYLYLSRANELSVFSRMEGRQPTVASLSRQPPNLLFAASLGGYVYSLDESNGRVLWRGSTGEPVSQSPVPIGDSLYVISDHAGMYSLSSRTGGEQWRVRGIRQFVAGSSERIYCSTEDRQLVALDAQSGARLAGLAVPELDLIVTNFLTDRLYVGTTNGTIQCLREIQQDWPLRHVQEVADELAATGADQPAAESGQAGPLPNLPPAAGGAPEQPGFDVFGPFGDEPAPGGGDAPAADDGSAGEGDIDPFGELGSDGNVFDF